MLTRSLPLLLLLSVACTDTPPAPEGAPALGASDPGWWAVVGPRIANDSRRIHDEAGVQTAHVGELTARFESDAVRLRAGGTAGPVVALRAWNFGGGWQEAGAQAPQLGGCAPGPELDPAGRCLPRLEYRRGGLVEWWASTAAGYEQGFEVASAAGGVVELELATGAEVSGEGGRLRLHPPEGPAWEVSGLRAWDARGTALPADMAGRGRGLVIRVDVAGAAFPVTIDPVYVPAETVLEEADGAALHGYALSTGDVNGDGYVDAVVGAPSSDVTATDGGALYSYLGSANGLDASGTRYAPAYGASANLGAAVSLDGDVTGDGYDDLVWGAPGCSSGQGAVGLVLGSASGLSSSAVSSYTFGSTGAWGTAVKIVPDWDGDGDDEVVTGAPDYDSATGLVYGFRGTSTGWTTQGIANGSAAGDQYGGSFVVGDFEGDGEEDLVVGAPGGGYATVLSHVYYTGAADAYYTATGSAGFGATLAAADLDGDGDDELVVSTVSDTAPDGQIDLFDGDPSFTAATPASGALTGAAGSRFGASLAAADLDGDGTPELAVGAYGTDSDAGAVHLYGWAGGALTLHTTLGGTEAGAELGFALAELGDVDDDGDDDLLVSAPSSAAGGSVYVVGGGSLGALTAGFAGDELVGDLAGGRFGIRLATAGDLNGDGYDDLAVGAPSHDGAGTDAGAAYVFHGSAEGVSTTAAATLQGAAAGDRLGDAVAAAGDVNGDGYGALLVSATKHDAGGADAGRVYLYEGSASGIGSATTTLDGTAAGEQFGFSLAGGQEVYGSGYADIVVGSPYTTPSSGLGGAGRVRVYRGSASGLDTTAAATLDGLAAGDYFGKAVALVDVNRDLYSDVVVGATDAAGSGSDAGEVYVYHGSDIGPASTASTTLDGTSASGGFGRALANAGDMNGDGYDDLMIGADTQASTRGMVYVYAGSAAGLGSSESWSAAGDATGDYAGVSVAAADFDGDGLTEPVRGSFANDDAGNDAGAVTLYTLYDDFDELDTQTLTGAAAGDYFGYALAAGDYNGDGFADLAVGAFGADPTGSTSGQVSVYYGTSADRDGDGVRSPTDCDDADPAVGAGTTIAYSDADNDGYGDALASTTGCRIPYGHVANDDDCNDGRSSVNPAAAEVCDDDDVDEDCNGAADDADAGATGQGSGYADWDGDGFGDATATLAACDLPAGYVADATDCDDTESDVYPGAPELCAGGDHDCDGLEADDDPDVTDAAIWYADADADGYGDLATTSAACVQPAGMVADSTDCDDRESAANPGASETCSTLYDDDCDGMTNDGDLSVVDQVNVYNDRDGDGYGGSLEDVSCEAEAGETTTSGDCDDFDAAVNPAATEQCDASNTDEDCDGVSDDDDAATGATDWYADSDGDGYGNAAIVVTLCDQPAAYVTDADDCDDADASVSPAGSEVCDASDVDEDCDGLADDSDPSATGQTSFHADTDADGYGDAADVSLACDAPSGRTADDTDCDDADGSIHPGAEESDCADPTDYNCDGSTGYADADADGAAACEDCDDAEAAAFPGGTEAVGDGIDGDCDGAELCYADVDADGYRPDDAAAPGSADCTDAGEAGSASLPNDCDDADAAVNPAATDTVGDTLDSDCDGVLRCWADPDGDGFHDGLSSAESADADCDDVGEAALAEGGDCNAADPAVYPGAPEPDCADPTDYNCDGSVGEQDADADGYPACEECDDGDAAVNPAATEVCNGLDDDCDGDTDPADAPGAGTWAPDADGDGYTDNALAVTACEPPEGYLPPGEIADCDDADASTFPGAEEVPDDGVDQDCDGADSVGADTGDDTGDDTATPDDTGDVPDSGDPTDTADTPVDGNGGADTGGKEEPAGDCGCSAGGGAADWWGLAGVLAAWRRRRAARR